MLRLALALSILAAAAVAPARPRPRSSEISVCGVSFRIPADWQVRSKPTEPGALCAAEILPRLAPKEA